MNTEQRATAWRISLAKSNVPEHNHSHLIDYLAYGQPCEDFLEAVLQNDLKMACIVADQINRFTMWYTVEWLYNHAPITSWGSPGNYTTWIKERAAERAQQAAT